MKPILKYILLTGIRDRLYIGLFITLALAFSLSIFIGSTALVEQLQMTTVYIAGSVRMILAIGMILFVCLNINKAFENKEVEFILSKAISREQFVLAYLCGFFISVLLIFCAIILAILVLCQTNKTGLLTWSLSLFSELMILISFSLVASLILKNAFSSIMASFGFYIISRMMGIVTLAIQLPQSFAEAKLHSLNFSLKILSVLFPRLDLFGQSEWIIYGISNEKNLMIILVQSLVYIPLLTFMAFHDFKKKQF